jgi:hypothetical protein
VLTQNRVINQMFGLAAERVLAQPLLTLHSVFATLPAFPPRVPGRLSMCSQPISGRRDKGRTACVLPVSPRLTYNRRDLFFSRRYRRD